METEMQERIKKVEASIEMIKGDISIIRTDNAVMKTELKNIADILKELPCKEHFAEDRKLEEKIAVATATALLKSAELKAEALLSVTALKEAHEGKFVIIEKKQDRLVTIWATISSGIILAGVIVMILVNLGWIK